MDRTVSESLVKSKLFIIHTILFCPRDDMEQVEAFHGAPVPFYEHDFRQKITVQNKKDSPMCYASRSICTTWETEYLRIISSPKYQQHPGDVHG